MKGDKVWSTCYLLLQNEGGQNLVSELLGVLECKEATFFQGAAGCYGLKGGARFC